MRQCAKVNGMLSHICLKKKIGKGIMKVTNWKGRTI